MRARLHVACVLLASLGGLAWSNSAAACSCGAGLDLLAPEEGATGVPLDTRVWLGISDEATWAGLEIVLFAMDDPDAVLARRASIATEPGDLLVLTPLAPLRPDTSYEVWGCEGAECRERILGFTTGTDLAAPPSIPELVDQDHDRSGGLGVICPREKTVELRTVHDGLLVVEQESRVDLELADVDDLASAVVITKDEVLQLDEGGCEGDWPGGRRVEVRLGAFDLAGNFSGFGDTEVLDIGCGCRADRRAPSGVVVLFVLFAGAVVRRRGRRSAARTRPA